MWEQATADFEAPTGVVHRADRRSHSVEERGWLSRPSGSDGRQRTTAPGSHHRPGPTAAEHRGLVVSAGARPPCHPAHTPRHPDPPPTDTTPPGVAPRTGTRSG